jgi:hypothetical protein
MTKPVGVSFWVTAPAGNTTKRRVPGGISGNDEATGPARNDSDRLSTTTVPRDASRSAATSGETRADPCRPAVSAGPSTIRTYTGSAAPDSVSVPCATTGLTVRTPGRAASARAVSSANRSPVSTMSPGTASVAARSRPSRMPVAAAAQNAAPATAITTTTRAPVVARRASATPRNAIPPRARAAGGPAARSSHG